MQIFLFSGKNSKDKTYREKGNTVVNKLKGNLNSNSRKILKTGMITEVDFVKGGSEV